ERALALELDAYSSILAEVSDTLEPHRLCGYLYDLARDFTTFYEACHVLRAGEPIRSNRLALCQLTAHPAARTRPPRNHRTRTHVRLVCRPP
ncbi:MAG: DALR anticodon-binding domain-containing protein, partial [Pseudonocardiaceae bacterium]